MPNPMEVRPQARTTSTVPTETKPAGCRSDGPYAG